MMFRLLSSVDAILPWKKPDADNSTVNSSSFTDPNIEPSLTNSASEISSLHDGKPASRSLSGWGTKIFKHRTPKQPTGKLAIGPSGAIIFKGRRSLDSLASTGTWIPGTKLATADRA